MRTSLPDLRIPIALLALLPTWIVLPAPLRAAEPVVSVAAAQRLLTAGKAAEAAAMFSGVLVSDPADAAAMAGRVRALIRQDLWAPALGEARAFREASPDLRVAGALAEALVRAGRLAEARAFLTPLAEDPKAGGRLLATFARVLAAEGRAEAESLAERAVDAAPEDRDVLLWASEMTALRPRTIELLGRYLELSGGDDADRVAAATQTRRFLEGIGDRRFWVAGQRPERLELPLRPVPGRRGPAGYTIEITGGEKARNVRLLLDTGSTGLFLVERAARRLGLVTLDEQTVFGGGGAQRHATQRGVLPAIAFGDLQFKDALITTSKRPLHPTGGYDGVISLACFEGYQVTIDTAARRLILQPPLQTPAGAPYWIVTGQWLVEAGSGKAAGLFLLDTGAQASVVSASFAPDIDDARLGGPASAAGYGGAMSGARWLHGARVQFAGRSTPKLPLRVLDLGLRSRLGGVELSGFVGLDILDGTRVILDTSRRRVAIQDAKKR